MLERIKNWGEVILAWLAVLFHFVLSHLLELKLTFDAANAIALFAFTIWMWRKKANKKDKD